MGQASSTGNRLGSNEWRWAAFLLAALLFAAGCFGGKKDANSQEAKALRAAGLDRSRTITIEPGQPIRIGVASTLSGDLSAFGLAIADAAETIPTSTAINGHPIAFVREDDLCTADGGAAAADRLIRAGVVAVVGPLCSGGVARSNPVFDRAGITHISVAATRTDLTNPQRPEGPYVTFLRLAPIGKAEAAFQAQFAATRLGAKTAYIVSDGDLGPSDLADQFIQAFRQSGGTVAGSPFTFSRQQSGWTEAMAAIKAANPGLIYFAGYCPEAATFLTALRADPAFAHLPVMATDGVRSPELVTRAAAAAEGLYTVATTSRGTDWGTYEQEYRSRFKGEPANVLYGAEAHDATTAIIRALQNTAKDDGSRRLTIDLGQLNKALRGSDFPGASGPVKFGANGERTATQFTVVQIKGGQWVPVGS